MHKQRVASGLTFFFCRNPIGITAAVKVVLLLVEDDLITTGDPAGAPRQPGPATLGLEGVV